MKPQINYLTNKAYKGKNQAILEELAKNCKFQHNKWATFLQFREQGLSINKGEQGVKLLAVMDKEEENQKERKGVKYFTVFNLEQTNFKQLEDTFVRAGGSRAVTK